MKQEYYLKEFMHHIFWCVAKQNVEVKDSSDGPVGHCWGRLQSHLWKKKKIINVNCSPGCPCHCFC